jgi:hypothetical protein
LVVAQPGRGCAHFLIGASENRVALFLADAPCHLAREPIKG